MSYRLYIKLIISIIIIILSIHFLYYNLRVLNLIGLTLGILGAIFLVIGSFDNFKPIIDAQDCRPLQLSLKNSRLLFKKYYDNMSTTWGIVNVTYPLLRLTAAELGPWLLLVGFLLQFYVCYIGP